MARGVKEDIKRGVVYETTRAIFKSLEETEGLVVTSTARHRKVINEAHIVMTFKHPKTKEEYYLVISTDGANMDLTEPFNIGVVEKKLNRDRKYFIRGFGGKPDDIN